MKADRIMDALGKVKEAYIMESAPGRKMKRNHSRWVAAAIVVVMLLAFFHTAPGVAALEIVKEAATKFIETLFPPKNIPVHVEGAVEVIHQEASGQEPMVQEDGITVIPGFAIYYDPDRYVMSEENGITYIRYDTDNELPPCEIEIKHISQLPPDQAAESIRNEMSGKWASVSEIQKWEPKDGFAFSYSSGTNWDSACGDVFFLSDGHGGTFHITTRYFLEATEGHGVRFSQMVQTFEIINP